MDKKSEKKVFQLMEQQEQEIENAIAPFYPDGVLTDFSHSSESQPLAPLLALVKAPPDPQAPTQEQLAEQCLSIRNSIKTGTSGNIEIQLNMARQLFEKRVFPLGNTIIKLCPMAANQPHYFFIKVGDTLDSSVFLGGNNAWGIMVLRDENGDDQFLRLSEFHLLSLRENPDPLKETGLMTSYLWLTAKVYSSIVCGFTLDPIKNLLLSDWLQVAWQQAKEVTSAEQATIGGELRE